MQVLGRQRLTLPVGDRVALGLVALVVGLQALANDQHAVGVEERGMDGMAAVLLTTATALAVAARRAPATATLAGLAVLITWYQVGYTSGLINFPYLVCLFFLGATGDRRRQLVVGGTVVAIAAFAMLGAGSESVRSTVGAIGWTLAGILFGELTHNRRALLAEYRARALRAEAERDAEAERRVAEARLEIARDLHDVLAHTVSVMTVQAGVGQDELVRGSDGAAAALRAIREAGREAMDEVQALVAVLRDGRDPATTAPAPGLDRLEELAAGTRAAGFAVDLTVDVPPDTVSDVVELTAYRVVQESLTNVARHAQATRASVTVLAEGGVLVVDVHDDGGGATTSTAGFGLRGMRERVESVGGHLEAGPDPDGGWRVRARIPVERRRR